MKLALEDNLLDGSRLELLADPAQSRRKAAFVSHVERARHHKILLAISGRSADAVAIVTGEAVELRQLMNHLRFGLARLIELVALLHSRLDRRALIGAQIVIGRILCRDVRRDILRLRRRSG